MEHPTHNRRDRISLNLVQTHVPHQPPLLLARRRCVFPPVGFDGGSPPEVTTNAPRGSDVFAENVGVEGARGDELEVV